MRCRWRAALLFVLLPIYIPLLGAADYIVSPAGTPNGSGTALAPWDLQTALNQPAAVTPGDTIWLRGGRYAGVFTSRLNGAPNTPIVVRNYAGERATIDAASDGVSGSALQVFGSWTWFWGIEVMNSHPVRQVSSSGSFARLDGIGVYGPNTKLINMVVHDNGNGYGFWQGADNSEIYGSLIYDNGWDGADRGHGHGIYAQNQFTTKWIRDNIYFNSFSYGIHIYGSSAAYLDHFWIEGNIGFNNGILSWIEVKDNILLGGENVARDETLLNNYTYFNPGLTQGGNSLGYDAGCDGLNAQGNYFIALTALRLNCVNATLAGNTFHGVLTGFTAAQYPDNAYNPPRTGVKVFVRPNLYERGRAHIAIYNWDNLSSVPVDLSGVLAAGESFEIRDAQNFFGPPVAAGTYTGAPVFVSMILTAVSTPVGNVTVPPVHTPPEFGAFVALKTAGIPPPPVNRAPEVSAGANQTVTFPAPAALSGSARDDALPSGALTAAWSMLNGPGAVIFGNANALNTTASFSAPGVYLLQLSAADGALSSAATVTITVLEPPGIYINAGGPGYTDAQNVLWTADSGFSGGASYTTASAISGTAAPAIYQTVRYGSFAYAIPVAAGYYKVVLKFAEVYWTAPRQRIFNVTINAQNVLTNFDIVAQAGGGFKALDRQFTVNALSGRIQIQFTSILDFACVSAIEVRAAAPPVTVGVTPSTASLSAAQSAQFTATVANAANTAVAWSQSPAGVGTLAANGPVATYTAPAAIAANQAVTITATSVADPSQSAGATVNLIAPPPPFNPIRVNAGGPGYTDPQGRLWSADTGYSGGAVYYAPVAVAGTNTPALYQSVRYLPLTYTFAVPNGTHAVTLKFAEIYFASPGKRVFNVLINGQPVLANFDIVAQAGAGAALDKQFTVSVTGGQISIQLTAVVENPMVSAIEIL